jgi:hypothetical protein
MRRASIVSIVCFCLGSFGLHAQSLYSDWNDSTKMESALAAPTNLTEEVKPSGVDSVPTMQQVFDTIGASAVILQDDKLYSYKYEGSGNVVEVVWISKKILIKDINALEEFSQFYFAQGEITEARSEESASFDAGFAILKPDGERIELDLANAEENEETVPYVFSAGNSDVVYYRTAVSSLEIGDIVEFHHQSEFSYPISEKVYLPTELQYEVIGGTYPTLRKTIKIHLNSDYFKTRCFSMNGAPHFDYKETPDGEQTIQITALNVPAIKSPRFYSKYRAEPFVKFQTYWVYAEKTYHVSYSALPYPLERSNEWFVKELTDQQGVKPSALLKIFKVMPFTAGKNGKMISEILKRMGKVKGRSKYSDLEFGLMVYEIFHDVYFEKYAPFGETAIGDHQFCNVMAVVFMRSKRQLDFVGYLPKSLGDYENLKFYEELGITIRIKDHVADDYYYFKPFTLGKVRHVNAVSSFTGAKFRWLTAPRKGYQSLHVAQDSIAETGPEINQFRSDRALSINLKNGQVSVRAVSTFTGSRATEVNSIAVPRITYVTTKQTNNKKKVAIQKAKRALIFERYVGYQLQYYESDWEDDFGVAQYNSLTTSGNGNLFFPEVKVEEELVIDDVIHPVGENFIFDAGRFIGGQFHIKENERERTKDINVPYPHKLANTVTFEVPEGYMVENLSALNCEFDCDAGLFSATASLDGNVVTIETKKVYKQANLAVENWSPMLQFLDLAHDFTYKKLLLRKL